VLCREHFDRERPARFSMCSAAHTMPLAPSPILRTSLYDVPGRSPPSPFMCSAIPSDTPGADGVGFPAFGASFRASAWRAREIAARFGRLVREDGPRMRCCTRARTPRSPPFRRLRFREHTRELGRSGRGRVALLGIVRRQAIDHDVELKRRADLGCDLRNGQRVRGSLLEVLLRISPVR